MHLWTIILLLLKLENIRGVYRIKFIVCNWKLLNKKKTIASDFKINVEKLVGATNWAKCKWQMNMHFERYDMMSIIDIWRKCPNVTKTEEASEAWKRNNHRRRRWSRVRWITWWWIWYWRRLTPRTFGESSAVCMKRAVFNNRVCWWRRIVQAQVRFGNGHCRKCR